MFKMCTRILISVTKLWNQSADRVTGNQFVFRYTDLRHIRFVIRLTRDTQAPEQVQALHHFQRRAGQARIRARWVARVRSVAEASHNPT